MQNKKVPLWKRSCIDELNLTTIESRLDDIAEMEYEYESNSRREDFQIFFSDISARAMRLSELLYEYRFELQETDECRGWNDFTVVLLGGTRRVLGFDEDELDYFSLFERGLGVWGERLAIEEAKKRLERLTKAELINRWQKVLTVLTCYLELIAAYDGLTAAMDFLENDGMKKSEELTNGIEAAYRNLWVEDSYPKKIVLDNRMIPQFEAALEKGFPEMWL